MQKLLLLKHNGFQYWLSIDLMSVYTAFLEIFKNFDKV